MSQSPLRLTSAATRLTLTAAIAALPAAASAQLQIPWYSIDCGGGVSAGGAFELRGVIGQHDAGTMSGGGFQLLGGFLAAATAGPTPCYPNCDQSTVAPILNVGDFTCFLQRFAAADPYANCDNSTVPPVLNVGDFTCFLQRFAAGCP
jgi:hypothetical protein